MIEKSGSLTLPEIKLHNGETLKDVVQVYSMYGEPNANKDNIVVVCHALTGSHRLAGEKVKGLPDPWWGTIVGDSKALDTRKYCIICFGNLASPYGSTSPLSINPETGKKFGMDFPILSPRDIAIAQKKALDELGFKKIKKRVSDGRFSSGYKEYDISFGDYLINGIYALIIASSIGLISGIIYWIKTF